MATKTSEFTPVEHPAAGDPLQVTVHRLNNGLTVYLSPNPQEPRVYYEIAVRAGSRHDPLEATGMAHYLEHMQFKGTRRLGTLDFPHEKSRLDLIESLYDELFETENPKQRRELYAMIDRESQAAAKFAVPNELDKLFSAAGFNAVNAHTSQDETVYKGSFPSNRAGLWAKIEADRLTEPVYRLFLPELEIVYEEFNKRQDEADTALHEASVSALFKSHPYGRDIIGLGSHLKNPSISRMRAFFRDYYRPNNLAIILSGDFDRKEMLSVIEREFGAIPPRTAVRPPAGKIEGPKGIEKIEVFYPAEEKVRIGWLIPGHNHQDEDALTLMDMLMDNQWTGILNLSVNKAQKVKDSGSFPIVFNEAGGWFIWAAPKTGQTLEEAETILLEAVQKLKAGQFSEEDLAAVRTDFEVMEKKRLEKNSFRASFIGSSFIQGLPWPEAAARLKRLERVTKKDVVRVAKQYLGDNRVVVYRRKGEPAIEKVQKPVFTPIGLDGQKSSPFFEDLLALPAKPLAPRFLSEGKDYRVLKREWGRLISAGNGVNDLFHLEFRFDLGVAHDNRLKPALKLLELSGAGEMGVEEFQRRLYGLGSKMSVRSSDRDTVVELNGLEKNLKETLRLALLRFDSPKTPAGVFEKMVDVERGDRQNRKLDPNQIFNALAEFARRGSDSAVLKELSREGLDALKEDELKELLRSLFDDPRTALYTGRAKAEAVADILSQAHGRRTLKPAPAKKPVKLIVPPASKVVFVDRPHLSQALIAVYSADGPYRPASRLDYRLFNIAMGGMSGVYFQEVREARALGYVAAGGYAPAEKKGDDNSLWAYAGTQSDKAGETGKLLCELMKRPPLTPERFASAMRQAEESFRTEALQLEEIPRQVWRWGELGFASDPRAESFQWLKGHALENLQTFSSRFDGKPLTICVLADKSAVDLKSLKSLGAFEERRVDELFPF